jgi:hypothetical protein
MVAPALVSTTVPAGTHRVVFRYRGYPDYALLFGLGAVTLIAIAGLELTRRRSVSDGRRPDGMVG